MAHKIPTQSIIGEIARKLFGALDKGKRMLRIIMLFVALAFVIYLFDRPIVPESIDRDPSALALADKIEKCERIYGNENDRKKDFAIVKPTVQKTLMIRSECVSTRAKRQQISSATVQIKQPFQNSQGSATVYTSGEHGAWAALRKREPCCLPGVNCLVS